MVHITSTWITQGLKLLCHIFLSAENENGQDMGEHENVTATLMCPAVRGEAPSRYTQRWYTEERGSQMDFVAAEGVFKKTAPVRARGFSRIVEVLRHAHPFRFAFPPMPMKGKARGGWGLDDIQL